MRAQESIASGGPRLQDFTDSSSRAGGGASDSSLAGPGPSGSGAGGAETSPGGKDSLQLLKLSSEERSNIESQVILGTTFKIRFIYFCI